MKKAFTLITHPQTVVGHGFQNLERRFPHEAPYDIGGWEIRNIDFPKGYSFEGWNLQRTKFIECDLSGCDFTGAMTEGMELDMCSIKGAKSLDMDTLAENRFPDPYETIAGMGACDFPARRRAEPPKPAAAKLT